MKKNALKALAVLAIISSAFAFKAHKNPVNLFIKNSAGKCVAGCSSAGNTVCHTQAYTNNTCTITTNGFEADQ